MKLPRLNESNDTLHHLFWEDGKNFELYGNVKRTSGLEKVKTKFDEQWINLILLLEMEH